MKTIYMAFKVGCLGFTDGTKNILQGRWQTEWKLLTSKEFAFEYAQRRISSIVTK